MMSNKPTFQPTRFILPTSHYDRKKADRAVAFIQSLKYTKGICLIHDLDGRFCCEYGNL